MLLTCTLTQTPIGAFLRHGWPFILAIFIALLMVTFIPALSLALV